MKHFDISEFDCQETGENEMDADFLYAIDQLREVCRFPFVISSGYRSPDHPIERAKPTGPGTHSQGIAADIKIDNSADRFTLLDAAMMDGFTGIGIHKDFIHLDMRDDTEVIWVY